MAGLCRGTRFLIKQHGRLLGDYESRHISTIVSTQFNLISQQKLRPTVIARQVSTGNSQLFRRNPNFQINLEQRRFKKRRASKQDQEEEEEDDDDDDEISNENPLLMDDILDQTNDGSEKMTINISSLRLDSFCKTAFSMTRAKVEELFYKNDIYINGELPAKKSQDISVGDEIDLVKSINADDSKLVNIKRAIILQMPDKASEHGRMKLEIQRWNDLSVEARGRGRNDQD